MQPQFQSSFIPKGSVASSLSGAGMGTPVRRPTRNLLSLVASALFALSVLAAGGAFLYKMYLNYSIEQMKEELQAAREAIEPETIDELINLNARLVSADMLIRKHRVLSPLFDFLETATPKTVRYDNFNFDASDRGLELTLQGQARGYAALAAAADVIDRSTLYLEDPVFSDLELDEKGNVIFTVKAKVVPSLLSYLRYSNTETVGSSTQGALISTTTPRTATSTSATTTATTTRPN